LISTEDVECAIDMAKQMSSKFNYERERKEAFIDIMRTYLQNYSFSGNEISGFQSDGHIVLTIKGEEMILSILEVKPEFGKGHSPFLGFAGAINTDKPQCDPLGLVIPLFYLPDDHAYMIRITWMLRALKECIYHLHKFYLDELMSARSAVNTVPQQANFPYSCEFNHLE
ncbi:6938_t:CDS:2, partial [Paraglomus occultum]